MKATAVTFDNSTDNDVFQIDEPASPRRFSIGDAWSWLFPVAAFALFESFASPGVAVAVACLKFGYPDFRTALWLRSDQNILRRAVLPACHVARGCFASTFWSLLVAGAICVFEKAILKNVPFAILQDLMITTTLMNVVTIGLGVVTLVFGVYGAVKLNLRVWMDPTIHQARRERRWSSVCCGRYNGFRTLSVLTMVFGLIMLFAAFFGGIVQLENPELPGKGERVMGALLMSAIIGIPAFYVMWFSAKAWHLSARTPEECWN